jgi:hypothetical protein
VRRAPRAPFVALVLAVLGAGLVGLLLLNTALAQGSFRQHDLQRRTAGLQDREQQLQIMVDSAGTPGSLAAAARNLGLVPADDPGFLQLTDGKVLGQPKAATKPKKKAPAPTLSTTPVTGAGARPSPNASGRPSASAKPSVKPSNGTSARPTARPSTKPSTSPGPRPSPTRSG